MYLSRLMLSDRAPEHNRFWQIGQPYALHQEVWRLQDLPKEASRDFLFRLDMGSGRPTLLILGPRPCVDDSGLWNVETKPFQPKLSEGQMLHFRLRANPVLRQGHVRHDVVMHAKVLARTKGKTSKDLNRIEHAQGAGETWLEARSERNGFRLIDVRVEGYRVVKFQKNSRKQKHQIRFGQVDFEGRMEVKDPSKLIRTLCTGLGPSRAFGCGMILVRRAD
ncbi:MAG: type I-E CRISPR-associated protein Cas6/Cse3/CasE [Planctomycetota bacterium]|nr:MAG: type I-E CRISPR-associated protein Cas6/Cse3/CasE [Planctomycetota bacterium]